MEDDRHYHNYLDAEDHGLALHLDDGACGVHVDGDHLPVQLASPSLSEDDVRVNRLQLDLSPISLVSTLHVFSRPEAVLADASHFDCVLLVRTVRMNRLGRLNEDGLTVRPLKGSHPHTQRQYSAGASNGPALQGGEVHEVRKVGVAVGRLGGQVDLQGEGAQLLLLAPWRGDHLKADGVSGVAVELLGVGALADVVVRCKP